MSSAEASYCLWAGAPALGDQVEAVGFVQGKQQFSGELNHGIITDA